jgi:hypothetical protein
MGGLELMVLSDGGGGWMAALTTVAGVVAVVVVVLVVVVVVVVVVIFPWAFSYAHEDEGGVSKTLTWWRRTVDVQCSACQRREPV